MIVVYVLVAILLIGVTVMVHELGHFFTARLCRIPVRSFGIGFGPAIWKKKSEKTDTEYCLRAIPLGGYCGFYGEDEAEPDAEDPRIFTKASPWKRMLTIFMGPMMNFVFSVILCIAFYAIAGAPTAGEQFIAVNEVELHSPAESAGLQKDDIIVSVNDQPITNDMITYVQQYQEGGEPLQVVVQRGEQLQTLHLTPFYDEAEERYRIGVSLLGYAYREYRPADFGTALRTALDDCAYSAGTIINTLRGLVTTGEGFENTGSIVSVIQTLANQSAASNWNNVIYLVVVISINLGLINLLPIPGLDGARIVFLLIEGIRRKPVNQRIESYVHFGGFVLLFGLMAVLVFKDIMRMF